MQTSDPNVPDENKNEGSGSDDQSDQTPEPSKTPEEIWDEIVAHLSDLSTDSTDDKTTPPQAGENSPKKLAFPTAPWVSGPRIEPDPDGPLEDHDPSFDLGQDFSRSEPHGPRDWDEDQILLYEIDRFVEPDPPLELSQDPVRNVGWFLTILAGLALLISAVFMRPVHGPSMLILLVLFLAGIALLIWRMPNSPNGSSDSGAIV